MVSPPKDLMNKEPEPEHNVVKIKGIHIASIMREQKNSSGISS